MADPELLLFDEPCAGLDLGGRESLVAVLGELAQGERPLVMVTHHLEEIPPGFTHALLLRAGAVVAAGPISATLSSAAVSDTFGVAVTVDSDGTRWSARVTAR
jgi:iron complex transport system ATP-binding protein